MSTFCGLVRLMAVVLVASASLVTVPALAWAQVPVTSFDQVLTRVKVGDTVFVTDATGREVKGKVLDLSALSLALRSGSERQEFPAAQVKTLTWQKPDSLVNGALIGLAVGAGAGIGILVYATQDPGDGSAGIAFAIVAGLGGVFAGIGTLIDAAIPAKTVLVYRAPSSPSAGRISIVPILTPRRQGVAVRVVF
jgi:hypothetical protein